MYRLGLVHLARTACQLHMLNFYDVTMNSYSRTKWHTVVSTSVGLPENHRTSLSSFFENDKW